VVDSAFSAELATASSYPSADRQQFCDPVRV